MENYANNEEFKVTCPVSSNPLKSSPRNLSCVVFGTVCFFLTNLAW